MLEYQFRHYFTVEEANALLPPLTELLLRLQELLEQAREEYRKDFRRVLTLAPRNGHKASPERSPLIDRIHDLIDEIHAQGVLLKDIDLGLIDFPHLRDGREVLLCWQLGEQKIEYWHELEAGYGGRQPLEE